jgi:hypothetical protein
MTTTTDPVRAAEAVTKAAAGSEAAAKAEAGLLDQDLKEQKPGEDITVESYSVIVERSNNEKIPCDVMAYELPILRAIHGEDRVHIQQAFDEDIRADVDTLYRTLKLRYNKRGDNAQVVERIYATPKDLARELGIKYVEPKAGGKVEASANVDNRPRKKAKAK